MRIQNPKLHNTIRPLLCLSLNVFIAPKVMVRAQGSLNVTSFPMYPGLAATTEDCIATYSFSDRHNRGPFQTFSAPPG